MRTYDTQAEEKTTIKWLLRAKMEGPALSGALCVEMDFYFTRPKSSKRPHHTVKPDVDNLVKAILDNGNGILWEDDKQIVQIIASKYYAEEAKTVIKVRGFDDRDN